MVSIDLPPIIWNSTTTSGPTTETTVTTAETTVTTAETTGTAETTVTTAETTVTTAETTVTTAETTVTTAETTGTTAEATGTTAETTGTTAETTETTTTKPIPDWKFYETVNVPVTTLVTGVILEVKFYDDVTHEYVYTAIDCDGFHDGVKYFKLNELTGSVSVRQPLIVHQFCLNVTATSSATRDQTYKTIVIDVSNGTLEQVLPVNYYQVHINESKEDHVTLLVDVDSYYESMNMAVYTLTTVDQSDNFYMNSSSGELFAIKGLDHELHPEYQLIISVTPKMKSEHDYLGELDIYPDVNFVNLSTNDVLVRVIVDDMNDHAPQFDVGPTYAVAITSFVGQGQIVTTLTATDADQEAIFNRIYFLMTDIQVPFYVNRDSGVLRATESLEILQTSYVVRYEFDVTAANSEDGQVMPSQLHLTVHLLQSDEILVMTTTMSSTDFDAVISEVIDIFRKKLIVEARIIQWETEADGSNSAYMYMLPLKSQLTASRMKRYVTSDDGPLKKKDMLSLIKRNADSLAEYFITTTAKTYDDLPQSKQGSSTSGLIVAIIILATLLALIVIGGAIIGYLQHRNVAKKPFPDVTGSRVNGPSEGSHFSEIKTMEKLSHKYEDLISLNLRNNGEVKTGSNQLETIRENEEAETEPEVIAKNVINLTGNPRPDPELDYLKSILVDKQAQDGGDHHHQKKKSIKFTDDVMSSNTESTTDDDVRL